MLGHRKHVRIQEVVTDQCFEELKRLGWRVIFCDVTGRVSPDKRNVRA
jgi:hypothetical protein